MINFNSEQAFKDYCEAHKARCIVLYNNDVFDVTEFLSDHPGGVDIIEDCNGCDISEIFHSDYPHAHSDSAIKMLMNYRIGTMDDDTSPDTPPSPNKAKDKIQAYPVITENYLEYKDGFKVDRRRGAVWQVLKMTKKNYLEMIHNPVVLSTCRLFDTPFVEYFSRNKPSTIILTWLPVVIFLAYLAVSTSYDNPSFVDKYIVVQSPDFSVFYVVLVFVLGMLLWTKAEYAIHRWIFHSDSYCPDNGIALYFHFLAHGVHHFIPQDKGRLVFPPGMSVFIFGVVYPLFMFLLNGSLAKLVLSGFIAAYICYDCWHYFSHHMTTSVGFIMDMKRYHIRHHYLASNSGYGITSKIWDIAYGTKITY
jgi:4-hydroxysphinganine ceramide fatty acyl 2-hydroxylase